MAWKIRITVISCLEVELELVLEDLLEEVGVVLVVEGRVAAQQDVRDHSDALHVHGLAVRLLRQLLGGDVALKQQDKW